MKGFHQWNFFVEEEMLIFEDTRTKKNFNISNLLKRFTILTFEHDPNDEFGILRVCWLKMFQLQDQNFAEVWKRSYFGTPGTLPPTLPSDQKKV